MKKILWIVLIAILATGWGIRFYFVNKDVDIPIVQRFPKGEDVAIGKDFFDRSDEDMDGYTVKVLGSELLPVKDFLKRYDAEGQVDTLGIFTDYIYVVPVSIANETNPHGDKKGIAARYYCLQGTDYILSLDDTCFMLANPKMPGSSFSLRKGTRMDMLLTFEVLSRTTSIQHLKDDPPSLLITQYPHQKMIRLE
jgi:hypothetical protein